MRLLNSRLAITVLTVISALVWLPAAIAARTPKVEAYGGTAGGSEQIVDGAGVGGVATGGALPFTGLDLGLIVAGAVLLVILGVVLRRAARERRPHGQA